MAKIVYIDVAVAQRDKLAPLYFPRGDLHLPAQAFLQLDTIDGEIGFTSDALEPLVGRHSQSRFIRWEVSDKLRGDRLEPLAEMLLPLLRRVCDGAFDLEDCECEPHVHLSPDAKNARDEIEAILSGIDWWDRGWEADIRSVRDFIDVWPTWLSANTPDADLEARAAEIQDDADTEQVFLDGDLLEVLKEMRDTLR